MPPNDSLADTQVASYALHAHPVVGCVEDKLSPALIALASLKWSTPSASCGAASIALASGSATLEGPAGEISPPRVIGSSHPISMSQPDQPAKPVRGDSLTISELSPPNSPRLNSVVVEICSEHVNASDAQTPPLSDVNNDVESEPIAPVGPLPKKKGRPPKKKLVEGEVEAIVNAKLPPRTSERPAATKKRPTPVDAGKPVRKVYKKKKASTRAEIMPVLTEGSPLMALRYSSYFDLSQLAAATSFHNQQQQSLLLGGNGYDAEMFDVQQAEYAQFADFPDEEQREEMEQMIDWSLTTDVSPTLQSLSPVIPPVTGSMVELEPENDLITLPPRLDTIPFPYGRYYKFAQPDYAADPFFVSLADYDVDSDSSLHDTHSAVSLASTDQGQEEIESICCLAPPLPDIDIYPN